METNRHKETENLRVNIKLENLGTTNKNKVMITTPKGELVLIFSYKTIVSFNANTKKGYLEGTMENLWGNTTGKLLNECCSDKTKRLIQTTFKEALDKAFNLIF